MSSGDDYTVEQFTLEPEGFAELVELIKTAFLHDSQQVGGTIAFTEETFNLMFGSPIRSLPQEAHRVRVRSERHPAA